VTSTAAIAMGGGVWFGGGVFVGLVWGFWGVGGIVVMLLGLGLLLGGCLRWVGFVVGFWVLVIGGGGFVFIWWSFGVGCVFGGVGLGCVLLCFLNVVVFIIVLILFFPHSRSRQRTWGLTATVSETCCPSPPSIMRRDQARCRSQIVVHRLFDTDHGYVFHNSDRR